MSVLYYEDLIYAVEYSLVTEVGGHITISGDALVALKNFISTLSLVSMRLAQCHPCIVHWQRDVYSFSLKNCVKLIGNYAKAALLALGFG